MTMRCPNCGRDFCVNEIVAEELWHEEEGRAIRDVVLQCPGCRKALVPASSADTAAAR